MSTARSVMFWIAIAYVLAFVVLSLLKMNGKTMKRIFLIIGGAYVATSIVLFATLTGIENKSDGGISPLSLYPMIVFAALVFLTAGVFALTDNKTLRLIFTVATVAALIAVIVCLVVYYTTGEPSEKNYSR